MKRRAGYGQQIYVDTVIILNIWVLYNLHINDPLASFYFSTSISIPLNASCTFSRNRPIRKPKDR